MTIFQAHEQLKSLLLTFYGQREASNIANLVMEHLTQKNRIDRLLAKDQLLSAEQVIQLDSMSRQLAAHRPVQYILGEAWFSGMSFYVNEHTLIPRPETEELIEWIASETTSAGNILDIGTGSGCIPISLKKKLPVHTITSIDISVEALKVAERNAQNLKADVTLLHMDFLSEETWSSLPVFDIIVSNPPYIKASESSSMAKHVLDYEPSIALFVPDNDALIFYRKIAAFAKKHLADGGKVFMEINETLGNEVSSLFEEQDYQTELKPDLQGKPRMVKAVRKIIN